MALRLYPTSAYVRELKKRKALRPGAVLKALEGDAPTKLAVHGPFPSKTSVLKAMKSTGWGKTATAEAVPIKDATWTVATESIRRDGCSSLNFLVFRRGNAVWFAPLGVLSDFAPEADCDPERDHTYVKKPKATWAVPSRIARTAFEEDSYDDQCRNDASHERTSAFCSVEKEVPRCVLVVERHGSTPIDSADTLQTYRHGLTARLDKEHKLRFSKLSGPKALRDALGKLQGRTVDEVYDALDSTLDDAVKTFHTSTKSR